MSSAVGSLTILMRRQIFRVLILQVWILFWFSFHGWIDFRSFLITSEYKTLPAYFFLILLVSVRRVLRHLRQICLL
jgi:hypothetical protein